MKKFYFMAFIASAALTMTSCSNDDLASTGTGASEQTAINFSTYLGRNVESRAGETNTTNLSKIGVYASYTQALDWTTESELNFMVKQEVNKKTGAENSPSWEYTPLKYWPANQAHKISFFAYAPFDLNNTNITVTGNTSNTENSSTTYSAAKGAPVATFAIKDQTIANTPDFVTACEMNKTQPSVTNNTVKFTLKHAMTRVAFKAGVSEDVYKDEQALNKTKVVITKVVLSGDEFTTNATYAFPSATKDNGTWTATGTAKTIDLASVLKSEAVSLKGSSLKGAVLTDKNAESILNQTDYLYLIPANNGAGLSAKGKVQATITYSIITEDKNLANGSVTTEATKTVDLPAKALAQGKSYTFTFTIGVNAIILDVENVENWGNDDETTTSPIQVSGANTQA